MLDSEQNSINSAKFQLDKGHKYFDTESQRIMLENLKDEYAAKGEVLDANFLVDDPNQQDNLNQFIDQLKEQADNLEPGQTRRVQVLYRAGIHTTVIDFKLSSEGIDCFLVDAANNTCVAGLQTALSKHSAINKAYVAAGQTYRDFPQKSRNGCKIFAMEMLRALHEEDPFEHLEKVAVERHLPPINVAGELESMPVAHCVDWLDLGPRFIKDCESRELLEKYHKKHPDATIDGVPLTEYVASHADTSSEPSEKYPNFPHKSESIKHIQRQYYEQAYRRFYRNYQNENFSAILADIAEKPVLSNAELLQERERLLMSGGEVELVNRDAPEISVPDDSLVDPYADAKNFAELNKTSTEAKHDSPAETIDVPPEDEEDPYADVKDIAEFNRGNTSQQQEDTSSQCSTFRETLQKKLEQLGEESPDTDHDQTQSDNFHIQR